MEDSLFRKNWFWHARGLIPDFHADTKSFLKIKSSFKQQADLDREVFVREFAEKIIAELEAESESPFEKKPSEEQTEIFLKNWMSLTAIQYRTLEEEFAAPKTEWVYEGEDANKWYPCIRAAD